MAIPLAPFQLIFGMELVVFLLLLLLVPLILFIAVAVWMYGDANSRGMSGGIWVLVLILASLFGSFVGGIIVVVIYLLVREGHLGARGYRYGYPYPPPGGYGYPPPGYGYSGYGYPGYSPPAYPPAPPAAAAGRCPRCGAATNPGARFCASCGSPL